MNFSRIISDLMVKNQKVTIPGLGIFTYSFISAEVYKFTNRVAPPTHKIEFNSIPDEDTRFETTCAEEYDTTIEKAKENIAGWVKEILTIIEKGGQFSFDNIGYLKKVSGKLHFTPDEKSVLFADNFGLESAKIPLMEIEEPKPVIARAAQKPIKKSIFPLVKKIVIIAAIVILILVGSFLLYETGALKSVSNALTSLFSSKKQIEAPIQLSDSAEALKRNALLYSEMDSAATIADTNRVIIYYIVAGSFKSVNNANKEIENLKVKGYKPEILNIRDTLFRVTIGTYKDRRKAVEDYIALTNQDKKLNIWLYSQLNR